MTDSPGLVALYDIRPGNGAGPFLQPRSPHGATIYCKIQRKLNSGCRDAISTQRNATLLIKVRSINTKVCRPTAEHPCENGFVACVTVSTISQLSR